MGVTYLIWLGFRKLLARDDGDEEIAVQPEPLPRVFEHGLLVQVLKSKVALFFLAFWSQFVDPSREPGGRRSSGSVRRSLSWAISTPVSTLWSAARSAVSCGVETPVFAAASAMSPAASTLP